MKITDRLDVVGVETGLDELATGNVSHILDDCPRLLNKAKNKFRMNCILELPVFLFYRKVV